MHNLYSLKCIKITLWKPAASEICRKSHSSGVVESNSTLIFNFDSKLFPFPLYYYLCLPLQEIETGFQLVKTVGNRKIKRWCCTRRVGLVKRKSYHANTASNYFLMCKIRFLSDEYSIVYCSCQTMLYKVSIDEINSEMFFRAQFREK